MKTNEDCHTCITLLTMIIIISYTKNVRLNKLESIYYFVEYMGYLKGKKGFIHTLIDNKK